MMQIKFCVTALFCASSLFANSFLLTPKSYRNKNDLVISKNDAFLTKKNIHIQIGDSSIGTCTSFLDSSCEQRQRSKVILNMAGFGGGGGGTSSKKGGSKKNKKKSAAGGGGDGGIKLKPKGQWDKYKSLKDATIVKVAARAVTDSNDGDWFEVGKIKSEGNAFTEIAVILQRGLIAEHAKRLHPLQFLPKDKVEWAYAEEGDDSITWVVVNKNSATSSPTGIEKKIGFEGKPDSTGFYGRSLEGRNGGIIVI